MRPPRNIVVCCDGTANEFKKDRTNVIKLFQALVKEPDLQACYYHPGVGTMAAPGFITKTGALIAEIAGLAFGYGLSDDICDAYTFVSRNFEPGDRLYLFGFSRGAYTVRALASLLHMYGLMVKDNDRLVLYAVRMMWAIRRLTRKGKPGEARNQLIKKYFDLAEQFKATFSRECKPYFVGVWDTVSSVGWLSHPLSLPFTANNPDIAFGRHAVAIDERRAFFRSNLWRPDKDPAKAGPKDLKQVWFPGVHCDVGGGYPEEQSALSKIPLQWMIDEARQAGLLLEEEKVARVLGKHGQGYREPSADGMIHESLKGAWKAVEYVRKPRWDGKKTTWRANRFRKRQIPPESWVHDAAWTREKGEYQDRLPRSAVRLSLVDPKESDQAVLPDSVLHLLVKDPSLGVSIDSGVVARIQQLFRRPGTAEDAPGHEPFEVVIPVGVTEPRSLKVSPGRYRIQAFLPSGRVIEAERVVAAVEELQVSLEGDRPARDWLGWWEFMGTAPDREALCEKRPARGPARSLNGNRLAGIGDEFGTALRHPFRLDWVGVRYLIGRLWQGFEYVVLGWLWERVSGWVRSIFGRRDEDALRVFYLSSRVWTVLEKMAELTELFGDRFDPLLYWLTFPGDAAAVDLRPRYWLQNVQEEGVLRRWVLPDFQKFEPRDSLQSAMPKFGNSPLGEPLVLVSQSLDAIEVAFLPSYWLDIKSQQPASVEALVDESSSCRTARLRLTVRDSLLGGVLAYFGQGRTAALRVMVEAFREDVKSLNELISSNPLGACALLYSALVSTERSRLRSWEYSFSRLAKEYEELADAQILYACWSITVEPQDSGPAISLLERAFRCGMPQFGAGVFLLREALARYSQDEKAKPLCETVARLARRVDPSQIFTVVRFPTS